MNKGRIEEDKASERLIVHKETYTTLVGEQKNKEKKEEEQVIHHEGEIIGGRKNGQNQNENGGQQLLHRVHNSNKIQGKEQERKKKNSNDWTRGERQQDVYTSWERDTVR